MSIVKRKQVMKYQRPRVAVEHTGFYAYLVRYLEVMQIRNYAPMTVHNHDSDIRRFVSWCEERGIDTPQEVTKPMLERYQKHLYYYRQPNGEPLSVTTRGKNMVSLRQFFKWLTQDNFLLYNPASDLVLPKAPSLNLPMVLTISEVDSLLEQPDTSTPYGVRDRAILEVLYSTGIRRSECCRLQLHDVNVSRLTVLVRQGKGGKDRLLPLGARAAQWVERYLKEVRPQLLVEMHDTTLFLNDYGTVFNITSLGTRIKRYLHKARITVPGACHLLRHAMATHMLENGADVRFIQAMLGHSNANTTQIYTHVSIRKLHEVHALTHPAKLEDKDALLAALAAEQDEPEDD